MRLLSEFLVAASVYSFVMGALLWGLLVLVDRGSIRLRNALAFGAVSLLGFVPALILVNHAANLSWWEWKAEIPPPVEVVMDAAREDPTVPATQGAPAPLPEAEVPPLAPAPVDARGMLIGASLVLGGIWLLGFLYFAARLAAALVALIGYRRCLNEVRDPEVLDLVRELGMEGVPLFYGPDRTVPFSIGILKPGVVLPGDALLTLSADELRMILVHEFTHVRNRDALLGVWQRLVEAIHWWNPFMRSINNRLSLARENLCDRAAAASLGNHLAYAKSLLQLAEQRAVAPVRLVVAPATSGFKSLQRRIRWLAAGDPGPGNLAGTFTAFLLMLGFGIAAAGIGVDFTALVHAHEPAPLPASAPDSLERDLVVYLPLQEDLEDHSPFRHPVEIGGDVRIETKEVAAYFDGDMDYLALPGADLKQRPFCISLWARLTGTVKTNYGLVRQRCDNRPLQYLHLMIRGERVAPYFGFMTTDLQGGTLISPDSGWVHYLFQFDGVDREIWINGDLDSVQRGPAFQGEGGNLLVGSAPRFSNLKWSDWKGYLRELRVYQRALDKIEIRKLASQWQSNPDAPRFFQDLAPDREAYLVGARVSLKDLRIRSIQPLYRMPDGRPYEGAVHGTPYGRTREVMARDGYLVGALVGGRAGELEGLGFVFMRRKGPGMDPGDAYAAPWIGGRKGRATENVAFVNKGRAMGIRGVFLKDELDHVTLITGWDADDPELPDPDFDAIKALFPAGVKR